MKDRLKFEKTILDNGIEIYIHKMDVPFMMLGLSVPVGSAHNTVKNKGGQNGMAHFLEHVTCECSKLYPERHSFRKFVTLNGGYFNAATGPLNTIFVLDIGSDNSKKAIRGLLSQVFNPIISDMGIDTHRGIVSNERKQREKYYPQRDEFTQYKYTKWQKGILYSIRQLFGSDIDLKKINAEKLIKFHSHYFNSGIQVIAGGKGDFEYLKKELSKLKLSNKKLKQQINKTTWNKKDYHVYKCKDIDHAVYVFGNFTHKISFEDKKGIEFIGHFLTNYTTGILNKWLREEKGLTYGVSFSNYNKPSGTGWSIEIPLNDENNVKYIKKEIHKKILEVLSDKDKIAEEVERRKSRRLFFYQTLENRLDVASDFLENDGKIYTEKELVQLLDKCNDTKFLLKIYKKYFAQDKIGEFFAVPKK